MPGWHPGTAQGLCEKNFCCLRQQNKIFGIAILTDFASQNQSKWRSQKEYYLAAQAAK
jgi:hypothetical protein